LSTGLTYPVWIAYIRSNSYPSEEFQRSQLPWPKFHLGGGAISPLLREGRYFSMHASPKYQTSYP
jgi:hypothetical protein